MAMRLRLPELLDEHTPPLSAYAVAKASDGRINESTLYRLIRARGAVELFSADLCQALCDVLHVGPEQLFELAPPPSAAKRAAKPATKRGRRA